MSSTKFENIDLSCYRGDSETYTYTITTAAGVAVNLSTYTISAKIRRDPDAVTVDATISIADTSPSSFSTGIVCLMLPAVTTAALSGTYWYDIEATKIGSTITLARGKLVVTPDVTRT